MAAAGDEGIEVVLSVGALDAVVVTLREFLHRANAVQVQAVVVVPDEELPVLVTCGRLEPIEVVRGEHVVHLPHGVSLEPVAPDGLEVVPPLPPFEVDPVEGRVVGPLGSVEAATRAVEKLAAILGPPNVAVGFYATTDPEVPFGIGARVGEPTVLTIGEEQFVVPTDDAA